MWIVYVHRVLLHWSGSQMRIGHSASWRCARGWYAIFDRSSAQS